MKKVFSLSKIVGVTCQLFSLTIGTSAVAESFGDLTSGFEQIEYQASAVSKFGMAKTDDPSRNSIGLSRDAIRMKQTLEVARNHFRLGDPERTVEMVRGEIARANEFDLVEMTAAYRLLFESYRVLGRDVEAARLCNTLLARAYDQKEKDRTTFDIEDEWTTSCALSFVKATQPMSKRIASVSEDELEQFVLSPIFKERTKYTVPRAILFASAYRNLNRNDKALLLLQNTLHKVSNDEPWVARAYVTMALYYNETGDVKNALRYLRVVAGDLSSLKAQLPQFKSDRYSSYFANISLARLYFKLGQNEEAKNRYLAALSDKDIFLPSTKMSKEFLSEDRFSKTGEETIRWELANALDASGKRAEASQQYAVLLKDKLKLEGGSTRLPLSRVDANALLYARSLKGDASSSQSARDLLTRLYAYADTDVRYVADLKKKNSKASLDQLENHSQALLLLADAHAVNVPEVQRLKLFQKVYEDGIKFVNDSRRDLLDALTPIDLAAQGILEVRELSVLARMGELQLDVIEKIKALDAETFAFWKNNEAGESRKFAELNRKEMFRRFEAVHDDVQMLLASKHSNQTERMHLKNQVRFEYLYRDSHELSQLMQSVNFLAREQKEGREKLSTAKREVESTQAKLDAMFLDHRLYGFQAMDVWRELPQFKQHHLIVSRTLRELHSLHRRMVKDLGGLQNRPTRDALELAWAGALKAEAAVVRATLSAVQEMQSRRRQFVGRAQEIMRIADMEERGLAKLQSNMRNEFATHLPRVAAKLEPIVMQFREDVRLAVADDEVEQRDNGEKQLQSLQRARDERLQWLRSLRQSIDWGLAR